ncbi:5-formyltetrahydrofolate cyclo-ligase [Inmirania thermothiophila]|uniref:5-formyltetrahydrofolate cyclo-ligase n=1 Tax=Inmirania thermothiophila TaxID=1750597 RepID=A0A3N1Y876_9GAMM|nr:5-formyltetrahydrofolate cyclo-ligase [Inmirania thermothiophila]ROR34721.1 5-formyltetrahydrofolate cyclo-ligase [Inmirania thermothiophila]
MPAPEALPALRRRLRAARRALAGAERARRDAAIVRALAVSAPFRYARRIALYLAHDGEPDLAGLLRRAWAAGKLCCLPVLAPPPRGGLLFAPFGPDTTLVRNRFGIPEPAHVAAVPAASLDLVLAPLVGFDPAGHRLGMGGGFYDRALAFLRRDRLRSRPRVIGVAYACQEVPALPARPWDVPLHGVVTEQGLRLFPCAGERP